MECLLLSCWFKRTTKMPLLKEPCGKAIVLALIVCTFIAIFMFGLSKSYSIWDDDTVEENNASNQEYLNIVSQLSYYFETNCIVISFYFEKRFTFLFFSHPEHRVYFK